MIIDVHSSATYTYSTTLWQTDPESDWSRPVLWRRDEQHLNTILNQFVDGTSQMNGHILDILVVINSSSMLAASTKNKKQK